MTLVKNIAFPNTPITSYQEDPAEWDTEIMEGATGATFRNSRRTLAVAKWRITLQDAFSSTAVTAALAVKTAAQGRLYGFKFTPPTGGGARDVAFTQDGWMMSIASDALPHAQTTISVELEEVLGGTPYP
jgi:hypothetical protein